MTAEPARILIVDSDIKSSTSLESRVERSQQVRIEISTDQGCTCNQVLAQEDPLRRVVRRRITIRELGRGWDRSPWHTIQQFVNPGLLISTHGHSML